MLRVAGRQRVTVSFRQKLSVRPRRCSSYQNLLVSSSTKFTASSVVMQNCPSVKHKKPQHYLPHSCNKLPGKGRARGGWRCAENIWSSLPAGDQEAKTARRAAFKVEKIPEPIVKKKSKVSKFSLGFGGSEGQTLQAFSAQRQPPLARCFPVFFCRIIKIDFRKFVPNSS